MLITDRDELRPTEKVAIMIELDDYDTAREWIERLRNNIKVAGLSHQVYDTDYTHPVIYMV